MDWFYLVIKMQKKSVYMHFEKEKCKIYTSHEKLLFFVDIAKVNSANGCIDSYFNP